MKLCFNEITAGRQPPEDFARHLAAIREGGWEAIELWLRHWDAFVATHSLAAARRLVDDAGLTASGGCAQPGLLFSEGEDLQRHRDELERRLEQCAAMGAGHLVITPGTPGKQLPETPSLAALDRGAENLRGAGDLAARYHVRLGIEFLKGARFVNNLPTALMLAQRANHPNVGVLVDTFHLYAGLSKVEDFDLLLAAPALLFFVHLNDVPSSIPRELWQDPDRVLPGEGAFPLAAIFAALRRLRYDGFVSLELFNAAFAERWASEPAAASRAAYAAARHCVAE